jgi:hypothetical protein
VSAEIKGRSRKTIEQGAGRDLDSYERSLSVTPPTTATIKEAQRRVKRRALNDEDARELLDMLGLLP